MKMKFTYPLLVIAFAFIFSVSNSQTAGDYRSAATGTWATAGNWEVYNGATWDPAGAAPTSADGVITIRTGHNITASTSRTVDQVVVDAGGTLTVNSSSTLTLNDGTGDDLVVNGNFAFGGFALLAGGGNYVLNGTMTWTSGTISCATTIASTGTVSIGLVGNPAGSDFVKRINNATVTNDGTINWYSGTTTGGIFFNTGALINNGTMNEAFSSNRGFFVESGTGSFTNNGNFNKTTTFDFANFNASFTNTGNLSGIGTYNLSGTVSNTGLFRPGTSPGILATTQTALTGGPTAWIELATSTTPGTGHDQLNFTGNINLSGATLVVREDDTNTPLGMFTIMTTSGGTFTNAFAVENIPLGFSINSYVGTNSIIVTKNFITLPAVWGDFSAIAKNNRVLLDWSTLQENNVSHFVVEYSSDGSNYSAIGTITARGNASDITKYSFTHNTPDIQKTNLYRIRQYDFDGKSAISEIRPVKFNNGYVIPVLATPNPVRDRLQLSVQADGIRIMLVDLNGRTIERSSFQPGNHEINMSGLAPGVYQLVIFQDGKRLETQKIVKQ